MLKKIVKAFAPPIFVDLARRAFAGEEKPSHGYFGDYGSWAEAARDAGGYDSDVIFEKVRSAVLKVKSGEAACERDSVTFDRIQYSWPLLSCLLWAAGRNGNRLDVIDFGGALGSSYFQNIKFLAHLSELKWKVVEQRKFVDFGRAQVETGGLKFYYTIDECEKDGKPDAVILSSVIQYIESPYELLSAIAAKRPGYVIVDRTPFFDEGPDRILVQKVPPQIYDASYPVRILNRGRFVDFMSRGYDLFEDFETPGSANVGCVFRGFLFVRK